MIKICIFCLSSVWKCNKVCVICQYNKYLYKFQYQSMKKLRIERTNSNINRLTQKRSSLNQEPLFVPYKIDWRPASPSSIENQSSSKVFFQNMKAELSTIKNDFQKLIKREINLKLENDEPLKPTNTNKLKSYSTSRKQSKAQNIPKEGLRYGKDQEEQLNRILNLQKNLPCSSKMQLKQSFAKSLQVREQRVMTSAFQAVEIGLIQRSRQNDPPNEQHKQLNEKAEELQKELQKSLLKIQKLQQQRGDLRTNIATQDSIIQNKSKQLQNKSSIIQQLQEEINNIRAALDLVHNQKDSLISESQNMINEMNNLHQHLSELSFHHNQLNIAYNGLLAQYNQQKEPFINMQRFCQDLQRRCGDIEADSRRKIEYLQKDVQEYQKREDMFGRQIENLKQQLKQKPTVIYPAEFTKNLVNAQMENLRDEVFHLTRQLQIEKQLHENLSNKCIEQLSNTNNMQQITRSFEEKIASLLDENTKLKCRVNLAESKLESISLQNKSYLEEIKLYEQREKLQMNKKQITTNQWESLTEEIERLNTENGKLQLQIETCQNGETNNKENNSQGQCEKLLSLSYQQRTQIEQLKQNVATLIKENDKMRQDLAHETKKVALFQSENLDIELKNELNRCQQVNKRLKEMLFQFVSGKLVMRQDDEQSDYYIQKLEELRREIL